jgi:DNA-damage-inducible protein J
MHFVEGYYLKAFVEIVACGGHTGGFYSVGTVYSFDMWLPRKNAVVLHLTQFAWFVRKKAPMVTVSARIDEKTKQVADYYLAQLGLTTSAAINIFFKQIANYRGLPFPLQVPGAVPIKDFDFVHPEYQELIDEVSQEYLYETR